MTAGWFIAYQSPELREFYGGVHGDGFLEHTAWVLSNQPFVYPLEVLRGALWVAAAQAMLRSTRGPWWLGTLQVSLWFALIQNDVHFMPNPLMTAEIRAYHFVETVVSNVAFVVCTAWLLGRSHRSRPAELTSQAQIRRSER
jgi:hypothetical protein